MYEVVDATGLVEADATDALRTRVRKVLRQAAGAASIMYDMAEAAKLVDAIYSPALNSLPHAADIRGALFVQALMLYCRATSSGDGRSGIEFADLFDDNEKDRHGRLVDLRNKVIAHYGVADGPHSQAWQDERAVVWFQKKEILLAFPYRRYQLMIDALNDLSLGLTAAYPIAEKKRREREEAAAKAISKLKSHQRQDIFGDLPEFNPYNFFKNKKMSDAFFNRSSEDYAFSDRPTHAIELNFPDLPSPGL